MTTSPNVTKDDALVTTSEMTAVGPKPTAPPRPEEMARIAALAKTHSDGAAARPSRLGSRLFVLLLFVVGVGAGLAYRFYLL